MAPTCQNYPCLKLYCGQSLSLLPIVTTKQIFWNVLQLTITTIGLTLRGNNLKGSLTLASLRRLIYLARKSLVNLADLSIRKSLVYLPHKILPASNLVLWLSSMGGRLLETVLTVCLKLCNTLLNYETRLHVMIWSGWKVAKQGRLGMRVYLDLYIVSFSCTDSVASVHSLLGGVKNNKAA